MIYQHLANFVLALHVGVVLFVVGGLAIIVVGNLRHWPWVNTRLFRLLHLLAIAVVVAESWLGLPCPLTTLEMSLRTEAQVNAYTGSFIEHWLQSLLYYQAPDWAFGLVYSIFGLLVIATWRWFPPR